MDLSKLGEFGLISRFQKKLKFQSPQVVCGIGDDCAVLSRPDGKYQVLTTDAMVETVHFRLDTQNPEDLGWKTLAVNISDVAAMGARPVAAVLSLGIPKTLPVKFLDRFYKGLNQASVQYQAPVVGGDTVASPRHLFINLALLGETFGPNIYTRSGARPGDALYVTGTLGDSAAGLKILQSKRKTSEVPKAALKQLTRRHLKPEPRLEIAQRLTESRLQVTSMIDISDGLTQDLSHILRASGVGAALREANIPLSKSILKAEKTMGFSSIALALGGGEDYELLFTLRPDDVNNLNIESIIKADLPVTQIGEITVTKGIRLIDNSGRSRILQRPEGFNHFRKKA